MLPRISVFCFLVALTAGSRHHNRTRLSSNTQLLNANSSNSTRASSGSKNVPVFNWNEFQRAAVSISGITEGFQAFRDLSNQVILTGIQSMPLMDKVSPIGKLEFAAILLNKKQTIPELRERVSAWADEHGVQEEVQEEIEKVRQMKETAAGYVKQYTPVVKEMLSQAYTELVNPNTSISQDLQQISQFLAQLRPIVVQIVDQLANETHIRVPENLDQLWQSVKIPTADELWKNYDITKILGVEFIKKLPIEAQQELYDAIFKQPKGNIETAVKEWAKKYYVEKDLAAAQSKLEAQGKQIVDTANKTYARIQNEYLPQAISIAHSKANATIEEIQEQVAALYEKVQKEAQKLTGKVVTIVGPKLLRLQVQHLVAPLSGRLPGLVGGLM